MTAVVQRDCDFADVDDIPLGFSASILQHDDDSSSSLDGHNLEVSLRNGNHKDSIGGSSVFQIFPPYKGKRKSVRSSKVDVERKTGKLPAKKQTRKRKKSPDASRKNLDYPSPSKNNNHAVTKSSLSKSKKRARDGLQLHSEMPNSKSETNQACGNDNHKSLDPVELHFISDVGIMDEIISQDSMIGGLTSKKIVLSSENSDNGSCPLDELGLEMESNLPYGQSEGIEYQQSDSKSQDMLNASKVLSAKELHDWAIIIDEHKIQIEGNIVGRNSASWLIRTSPIVQVLCSGKIVQTYGGSCYKLVGDMLIDASVDAGVPLGVANKFIEGFPDDWVKCCWDSQQMIGLDDNKNKCDAVESSSAKKNSRKRLSAKNDKLTVAKIQQSPLPKVDKLLMNTKDDLLLAKENQNENAGGSLLNVKEKPNHKRTPVHTKEPHDQIVNQEINESVNPTKCNHGIESSTVSSVKQPKKDNATRAIKNTRKSGWGYIPVSETRCGRKVKRCGKGISKPIYSPKRKQSNAPQKVKDRRSSLSNEGEVRSAKILFSDNDRKREAPSETVLSTEVQINAHGVRKTRSCRSKRKVRQDIDKSSHDSGCCAKEVSQYGVEKSDAMSTPCRSIQLKDKDTVSKDALISRKYQVQIVRINSTDPCFQKLLMVQGNATKHSGKEKCAKKRTKKVYSTGRGNKRTKVTKTSAKEIAKTKLKEVDSAPGDILPKKNSKQKSRKTKKPAKKSSMKIKPGANVEPALVVSENVCPVAPVKLNWSTYKKGLLRNYVDQELSWTEISEKLNAPVEECEDVYKKMATRKKRSRKAAKDSKDTTERNAKKGSLKHRAQMHQFLSNMNKPNPQNNDIFAAETSTNNKFFSSDLFSVTSKQQNFIPVTPNSKPPIDFDASMPTPAWFKTPTASHSGPIEDWAAGVLADTPGISKRMSYNGIEISTNEETLRKETDRVILQMGKKMMKGTLSVSTKNKMQTQKVDKVKKALNNSLDLVAVRNAAKIDSPNEDDSLVDEYFDSD